MNTASNDNERSTELSTQATIQTAIDALHRQCISAILASTDAQGHAQASYTPYALLDGHYYVFISALAAHTGNILNTPKVGLLIIEDESSARNLYARTRLSYDTDASVVARDSDECAHALSQLRERAGNTVDMLSQLGDFVMVKLTPYAGSLVLGFGKAYALNPQQPSAAQHINEAYLKQKRANLKQSELQSNDKK